MARAPRWEPESLLRDNADYQLKLNEYMLANQLPTRLGLEPRGGTVSNLDKQGGCGLQWECKHGSIRREKAIFHFNPTNPQLDIQPTRKCELEIREVQLFKPWAAGV